MCQRESRRRCCPPAWRRQVVAYASPSEPIWRSAFPGATAARQRWHRGARGARLEVASRSASFRLFRMNPMIRASPARGRQEGYDR
jgi:hypothetical protein